MARFTLHVPPEFESGRNPEALERLEFVRDGFSWSHAAFGPLAFFARGFWRAGLVALVAFVVVIAAASLLKLNPGAGLAIFVLLALAMGLEASSLERFHLRQRGFVEAGVIIGAKGDALEREAIARLLDQAPAAAAPVMATPGPHGPVPSVLGLFPRSGGKV